MTDGRTTFATAALAVLLTCLLLEATARTYLALAFEVPLSRPSCAVYQFYPSLRKVVESPPQTHDDETFRVLLLGGSVLESAFGDVDGRLKEALGDRVGSGVEVVNLAFRAHTTRDSLSKYRRLQEQAFDLVLVYHGINETRANNSPARVFKDDYSHYSWYHTLNTLEAHPEVDTTALPLVFHLLWNGMRAGLGGVEYLPVGQQSKWTEHGGEVKTAGPFRRNIEEILSISRRRGETLILPTFTYYVPPDYSRERFQAQALDYDFSVRSEPIELWGRAEFVSAAIDVHNDVIRSLAATNPDIVFVDVESRMPHAGAYFHDVCHLSAKGREEFVRIVVEGVEKALRVGPVDLGPSRRRVNRPS